MSHKITVEVDDYLMNMLRRSIDVTNQLMANNVDIERKYSLKEIKEELERNCPIDIQERIIRKLQNSKS